ncbi:MAG: hypothetical protein K2I23_00245 [Clostridia bacterium]|nr:hypothetical protein [Clostridia bacterium]
MKKRIAVVVLLIVIMATSLFAFAGCQKTNYVIGVMENSEHFSSDMVQKGFRETLSKLMSEAGKTYKYVYRKSGGDTDEDIAASEKSNVEFLVSKKKANVILTLSQSSADSVLANASDTPMVFAQAAIADRNLQKDDLRVQIEKQVELMRIIAPNAKLGILYCNPTIDLEGNTIEGYVKTKADINMELQIELAKECMAALGVECSVVGYAKDEGKTHDTHIREALNDMKAEGVGCVFLPVDNTLASVAFGPKIHERGNTNIYTSKNGIEAREVANMPIVCGDINMNEFCGVATYAVDYYAMGAQAAQEVFNMLTGANESKYVEIKTDFSKGKYVVNDKVAEEIGFAIPQTVKDLIA